MFSHVIIFFQFFIHNTYKFINIFSWNKDISIISIQQRVKNIWYIHNIINIWKKW